MDGKIVSTNNIVRGPARVLYYTSTISGTGNASTVDPVKLSDILTVVAMDGAAKTGWTDFGAVDGGVVLQRTITTDEDVVDNLNAPLRNHILSVKDIIIANFAETSFENLQIAWELGGITTNTTVTPNEKVIPLSVPVSLTPRAIAFLHKKPDGKLRCVVAFNASLGGVASGKSIGKTPKAIIPVQFDLYPVLTITDSNGQPSNGKILEQVSA